MDIQRYLLRKYQGIIEKIQPLTVSTRLLKNHPGFEYEEVTKNKNFRIKTSRMDIEGEQPRYIVTLFDESLAVGRKNSQESPLDIPGYVADSSEGLTSLWRAIGIHRGLLKYLNEKGL